MAFLLYFFFVSIVLYGVLVTIVTASGFFDVRVLLSEIGAPASLFDAEYFWILVGMPIGTSSFFLFLVVWHFLWRHLTRSAV